MHTFGILLLLSYWHILCTPFWHFGILPYTHILNFGIWECWYTVLQGVFCTENSAKFSSKSVHRTIIWTNTNGLSLESLATNILNYSCLELFAVNTPSVHLLNHWSISELWYWWSTLVIKLSVQILWHLWIILRLRRWTCIVSYLIFLSWQKNNQTDVIVSKFTMDTWQLLHANKWKMCTSEKKTDVIVSEFIMDVLCLAL